jgi:hypothetical protein|tara:strand:- start:77 stop:322 length:246 start_codon:yes stop_codon:yes gene_type:complete
MPIRDDSVVSYKLINGEKIPEFVVPAEVTITNTVTGNEYASDEEAQLDVDDVKTDTKKEHIRRDVMIKVAIHELIKSGVNI